MLHTLTRTPQIVTGPALVFLHYYGGSIRSWSAVVDRLSADYYCLVIDLPGFGDSPPLSDHQTVDEVANAVTDAISVQLGDRPFVLVGHSMGGKIALTIAAGTLPAPTVLQGLVLLAPSPPVPEPIPDNDRQEMLDQPSLPPDEQQKAAAKTADTITNRPLSELTRQLIISDNLRSSPEGWTAWLTTGSREDISGRMTRINVPITILAGDHDNALSHSVQTDMVLPYLPQAALTIVEGAGHLLPIEEPDLVSDTIKTFCRQFQLSV